MPLLEEEYRKEEKINGVIYDMSPSPNYQHGLVDGNIYRIISTGLQGTLCLAFMENLDYKYHAQENNDYVIPDVMIICDRKHLKGGSYTGTPRFIVETLSPVEIYYLENGKYDLKYSYILQDDSEEEHYNADTVVTLKDFPKISMTLAEMFENVE